MIHAIVYLGPFELNFGLLSPRTLAYVLPSGVQRGIKRVPAKVEGLVFGCMQDGDDYQAVKASDIILKAPVKIVPGVHTPLKRRGQGKGFGPSQYTFIGDGEALQLLRDMAEQNRAQRHSLLALWPE